MGYSFPEDKRFRELAAKLADVVTVAINNGVVVRPLGKTNGRVCRCPLGCLPDVRPFPPAGEANVAWGCTEDEATSFIEGFEGGPYLPALKMAFYQLGRAYRSRFMPA